MSVSVSDHDVSVNGAVFRHVNANDPDSDRGVQVGSTLEYSGLWPDGVDQSGEFGVMGSAISAQVDSSVTNFCQLIP
jgi:hypothetical protein